MPQIAIFLFRAINLLVDVFPDHQSFLSPAAPLSKVNAAIATLVSALIEYPTLCGAAEMLSISFVFFGMYA
jgi:hypothetical protein